MRSDSNELYFARCGAYVNVVRAICRCDTPIKAEHYLITGGLRYVLPYHFDFRLNVKKRMIGMRVVDLFEREFPVRPRCGLQPPSASPAAVLTCCHRRGYHNGAAVVGLP